MIARQLKQLRKEKKITQSALANELSVTQQAVAKWEAGKSSPDSVTLMRLAKFFEVSCDFLLGQLLTTNKMFSYTELVQVPIIGSVRAGYNAFANEDYNGTEPANVKNAENYFYFVVQGDSMEPYIKDGDLALVRYQPTLEDGDLGIIIYGDGEATLKRYHHKDGHVLLQPFNSDYEPIAVSGEELEHLHIFGKVVETKTRW